MSTSSICLIVVLLSALIGISLAACSAGSITNPKNPSLCIDCVPGYYCPSSTNTAMTICPAGYYCSNPKMVSYTNYPCRAGSFCPLGSTAANKCTAGYYCDADRLSAVTGMCTAGRICPIGSSMMQPCPTGWFCYANGLYQGTRKCPPGSYCPVNATIPIICPAGSYCPLASVAPVNCTAGSYCAMIGLSTPTALCPPGTYCPGGNISPLSCLINRYCPIAGASVVTACPSGYACLSSGLSVATICPAGSICTGGTRINCISTFYCPLGSSSGTPCPAGYYCPSASASPTLCTGGSFCIASVASPTVCGTGYICPPGSSAKVACVADTYVASLSASSCTRTARGYYALAVRSAQTACTTIDTNCATCTGVSGAPVCLTCSGGYWLQGSICDPQCNSGSCLFGTTCFVGEAIQPASITIDKSSGGDDDFVTMVNGVLYGITGRTYNDITISTSWMAAKLAVASVKLTSLGNINVLSWPQNVSYVGNSTLNSFTLSLQAVGGPNASIYISAPVSYAGNLELIASAHVTLDSHITTTSCTYAQLSICPNPVKNVGCQVCTTTPMGNYLNVGASLSISAANSTGFNGSFIVNNGMSVRANQMSIIAADWRIHANTTINVTLTTNVWAAASAVLIGADALTNSQIATFAPSVDPQNVLTIGLAELSVFATQTMNVLSRNLPVPIILLPPKQNIDFKNVIQTMNLVAVAPDQSIQVGPIYSIQSNGVGIPSTNNVDTHQLQFSGNLRLSADRYINITADIIANGFLSLNSVTSTPLSVWLPVALAAKTDFNLQLPINVVDGAGCLNISTDFQGTSAGVLTFGSAFTLNPSSAVLQNKFVDSVGRTVSAFESLALSFATIVYSPTANVVLPFGTAVRFQASAPTRLLSVSSGGSCVSKSTCITDQVINNFQTSGFLWFGGQQTGAVWVDGLLYSGPSTRVGVHANAMLPSTYSLLSAALITSTDDVGLSTVTFANSSTKLPNAVLDVQSLTGSVRMWTGVQAMKLNLPTFVYHV